MREKEIFWQKKLDCTNPEVGYNQMISSHGGHSPDFKYSAESCDKISKSKLGHKYSDEFRKHRSEQSKGPNNNNFGKITPQSVRDKIAEGNRKYVPTEEYLLNRKARFENRPVLECKYCGLKTKSKTNIERWHNENCKHKKL